MADHGGLSGKDRAESKGRQLRNTSPRVLVFILAAASPLMRVAQTNEREMTMSNQTQQPQATNQPAPTAAVRLIFEYEGEKVRLVSQQPINLAVTGSDIARTEEAGVYVDVRNAEGANLARVPARNAFAGSLEVFPEKHGDPIMRIDMPKPKGAFTVVVPAPAAAKSVSVVRVSAAKAAAPAPSARATSPIAGAPEVVELASFPLNTKP